MQPDALLTRDELDFIQTLQHAPHLNLREASSSLLVNGGTQIRDLLTRLAANEQVTLEARFENQQMTFPLQLVEDEFHALHLRLGTPSIFEDGPTTRPWRLILDAPMALENLRGQAGTLRVLELSFKGLLLESSDGSSPPRQFQRWLNPADGQERIALRATLERKTDTGRYAYRLSQRDTLQTERLRQFILGQHRRVHPDLHQ